MSLNLFLSEREQVAVQYVAGYDTASEAREFLRDEFPDADSLRIEFLLAIAADVRAWRVDQLGNLE